MLEELSNQFQEIGRNCLADVHKRFRKDYRNIFNCSMINLNLNKFLEANLYRYGMNLGCQ